MRRNRRKRVGLPLVAIVGYTNAGKSTLLNRLTRSEVDVSATPAASEVILTDTVGFTRDLPKDLVHAFRSTLDEALQADLLLHVVNASDEDADIEKAAVDRVLRELGAHNRPTIVVLNQSDRADPDATADRARAWDASVVSAHTGEGLDKLVVRVLHTLDDGQDPLPETARVC